MCDMMHCRIVVLLSGDGMSEDSSLQVSSILTDHTHQLPLDIGHVTIRKYCKF